MRNILLKIAYDGTGFSGWQRQNNARTVCGTLEQAISVVCPGQEIKLDGTSRTDAGVHAMGQQATLHLEDGGIPTERIPKAVNNILASDRLEGIGEIMVLEAKDMPEGFHARYDSKGKRYIYKIYNCPEKSVFRRTQFYQIAQPLNLDEMKKAAAHIVGEHDFACFQTAGGTPRETTVREVYAVDITKDGDFIQIAVSGNGFLYNMVRIIVGTLVEVGLGKRTADSVKATIESCDRSTAGHTAPPQGLYLETVFY